MTKWRGYKNRILTNDGSWQFTLNPLNASGKIYESILGYETKENIGEGPLRLIK